MKILAISKGKNKSNENHGSDSTLDLRHELLLFISCEAIAKK
jgi:hypothetical protein